MGCQHFDFDVPVEHKGKTRLVNVVCDKTPTFTMEARAGEYVDGKYHGYGSSSTPLCEEHLDDAMRMMEEQIAALKMYLDAQRNGWGE